MVTRRAPLTGPQRSRLALQAFVIAACALGIGGTVAFFLVAGGVITMGCSPTRDDQRPHAAAPTALSSPLLPQPVVPFQTVPGPTPLTPHWVDALRCWGAEDYYPEPAVAVVPCPISDAHGLLGFDCRGTPCYGTIDGTVQVCSDLAGLPHEFSHAAHYYLHGSWGEDRPSGSILPHCAGVLR